MGDPSIPYPFKYFEKISHIPKRKMANIPKSRKHCIPKSLELIKISCIPLNIYKNIPYPFMRLAHIPVSLNPFQGLTICCIFVPKYLIKYSKKNSKRPKLGFQDRLSLECRSKYYRRLRLEHSAILSSFIKLPFIIRPGCCPFLSSLYWLCQVIHTCIFANT